MENDMVCDGEMYDWDIERMFEIEDEYNEIFCEAGDE